MAAPDLIGTCLWFENRAVEAAEFYVSLFPESRIVDVSTVGAGPARGNAFVTFELAGRTFQGIDGGPMFKFTRNAQMTKQCNTTETSGKPPPTRSRADTRLCARGSLRCNGFIRKEDGPPGAAPVVSGTRAPRRGSHGGKHAWTHCEAAGLTLCFPLNPHRNRR